MRMPLVPDETMPAVTPSQEKMIDFVMVTVPNPPESRQSISPPAAVFEMAAAKVWQGAVRLHGLPSLPVPDTQVRVCAYAGRIAKQKTIGCWAGPLKSWRFSLTVPLSQKPWKYGGPASS